jgi:hypothetical protein
MMEVSLEDCLKRVGGQMRCPVEVGHRIQHCPRNHPIGTLLTGDETIEFGKVTKIEAYGRDKRTHLIRHTLYTLECHLLPLVFRLLLPNDLLNDRFWLRFWFRIRFRFWSNRLWGPERIGLLELQPLTLPNILSR